MGLNVCHPLLYIILLYYCLLILFIIQSAVWHAIAFCVRDMLCINLYLVQFHIHWYHFNTFPFLVYPLCLWHQKHLLHCVASVAAATAICCFRSDAGRQAAYRISSRKFWGRSYPGSDRPLSTKHHALWSGRGKSLILLENQKKLKQRNLFTW